MNKKEDTTKTLSEDGWKMLKEAFTVGFNPIEPPTLATGIGNVSFPFSMYFSSSILANL